MGKRLAFIAAFVLAAGVLAPTPTNAAAAPSSSDRIFVVGSLSEPLSDAIVQAGEQGL
jgi:hypothetical protein